MAWFRKEPKTTSAQHFSEMPTRQDLEYCYRLLLQRPVDTTGLEWWWHRIQRHHITLPTLVEAFMHSPEFEKLHYGNGSLILVPLDGYSMYVSRTDFGISNQIATTKSYEPSVTRTIKEYLNKGDVFVDVGANIGFLTMLAASIVGPEGKVLGFEPNPNNYMIAQKSVELNAFDHVELFQNAVSDVPQSIKFISEGSNGYAAMDGDPSVQYQISFFAQAVVLDDALKDAKRIDMIKMDIEGAEPQAIKGMQQVLKQHRPIVITEFSPSMMRHVSNVDAQVYFDLLRAYSPNLAVIEDAGLVPAPATYPEFNERFFAGGNDHIDIIVTP